MATCLRIYNNALLASAQFSVSLEKSIRPRGSVKSSGVLKLTSQRKVKELEAQLAELEPSEEVEAEQEREEQAA